MTQQQALPKEGRDISVFVKTRTPHMFIRRNINDTLDLVFIDGCGTIIGIAYLDELLKMLITGKPMGVSIFDDCTEDSEPCIGYIERCKENPQVLTIELEDGDQYAVDVQSIIQIVRKELGCIRPYRIGITKNKVDDVPGAKA